MLVSSKRIGGNVSSQHPSDLSPTFSPDYPVSSRQSSGSTPSGELSSCTSIRRSRTTAGSLRRSGEFHHRGILDRQQVPPGDRRAGQIAPSLDDLRGGYFRIGEEPARLRFTTTVTTQPAQAHRLARDHAFEDRPPLSRRASPNDPSGHSISAPVLRLPRDTELYSRRVGQEVFAGSMRFWHHLCAFPSSLKETGETYAAPFCYRYADSM